MTSRTSNFIYWSKIPGEMWLTLYFRGRTPRQVRLTGKHSLPIWNTFLRLWSCAKTKFASEKLCASPILLSKPFLRLHPGLHVWTAASHSLLVNFYYDFIPLFFKFYSYFIPNFANFYSNFIPVNSEHVLLGNNAGGSRICWGRAHNYEAPETKGSPSSHSRHCGRGVWGSSTRNFLESGCSKM